MKKKLDLLLLMSPLLLPGLHIQAQEKHNLVFIMADQWRGNAIGCLEKEPVKTPCLDKLASEGVNFTNAISSYPVSSPARAMLMTGMYPHKNKVIGNCNSENAPYEVELPQNARCWSDVLKDNDYQTGYIGKWHLDSPYKPYVNTYNNQGTIAWNEWCPKERRHGFDYWTAYGTYDYHLKPMYWDTDAPRDSFYYVNQWGPEYEADKAIEYLNNYINPRKPFALVVSMNPPHTGYELVPDKYKEISDTIMTRMNRGVTGIAAKGMYSDETKNMLFCVVSRKEIVEIKEIVSEYDPRAFFIVSDAREVFGEGFIEDKNQLT